MKPHILTRPAIGALASAAVLLPLTACGNGDEGTGATGSTSVDPSTTTPEPGPAASGTSSSEYQDGTYTARGVYGGAPSYMDFTISLEDGVITGVDSELMEENNDTSRGYQERFAAAVPDEVVGESIEDLEVGVIAGASGCADGFNDALARVRDEARADAGQTPAERG
ncbi:hypothetical protein [Rothia halotolerans]|uniref:hypothetical protein n=1 Tax=Rothia halotolerans TaxID=405770 RepID=UPI00101CA0A7|nr:hypothetical protein [Rothia halotolerans]